MGVNTVMIDRNLSWHEDQESANPKESDTTVQPRGASPSAYSFALLDFGIFGQRFREALMSSRAFFRNAVL